MSRNRPCTVVFVVHLSLLDAALKIIATEGASALRVRRIAEVAGCSTKGVYSEYGGKNGLIEAICVDGFTQLRDATSRDQATARGVDRIFVAARGYRAWALSHPTQFQVMFGRAVPEYEPTARNREAGIQAFEVLVSATAAASSAGDIETPDPYRAAMWIWGAIHGQVMLELAAMAPLSVPIDYETIFEETLRHLLHGLKPQRKKSAS
jgi:AcrR family transcriptional regulator